LCIIYLLKTLALSNDETQCSALVEPQTYTARCLDLITVQCTGFILACAQSANYFNLQHFGVGVVTGYREGLLNLLNLFSLKRLSLLSQF